MTRRAWILALVSIILMGVMFWEESLHEWIDGSEKMQPTRQELEGYASYSLKKKIRLLEGATVRPMAKDYMVRQIARHGDEAYEELLPYLRGAKKGIHPDLVAQAMMWIHAYGYNLRDSLGEKILVRYSQMEDMNWYWLWQAKQEIQHKPAGHARDIMEDEYMLQVLLRVR